MRTRTPADVIGSDQVLQEALGLPSSGDFKFGFKVSVFNWRMRSLRRLLGITQKQLGGVVGVSAHTIGQIETFKIFPNRTVGERIAGELRTSIQDLFPEWLRFCVLDASSREFVGTRLELRQAVEKASPRRARAWAQGSALPAGEAWEPTMVVSEASDPLVEAEREEVDATVREVLQTLTPREQKVLILRFGLDGGGSRTLEEVGRYFEVDRERIRQIEAKALRKLRVPSRSKRLRSFLEA